jgi:hypothetical protein
LHHFDEEQATDSDHDQHQFKKFFQDPDLNQREKRDLNPDLHHSVLNPLFAANVGHPARRETTMQKCVM